MSRRRALALLAGLAASAWVPTRAASVQPRPVGKDMRCPVCGMFAARYPAWQGEIVFTDDAVVAFDNPADLFRFLHGMERWDKRHTASDVAAVFVADYGRGGGLIDARTAHFVKGSSICGPMKDANLPAFASRAAADEFVATAGGEVIRFERIDRALLKALAAPAHRHDDPR